MQALEAFETGKLPEVVHFKALYRLAREEGYPVKEQWWTQKNASDRARIVEVLRSPLLELVSINETPFPFLDDLKHYLHHQTDILIPELLPSK
jgi:hypothetical protein